MLSCDTSRFCEVLHPSATQQKVTFCLRDRETLLSNIRLCFPFTFLVISFIYIYIVTKTLQLFVLKHKILILHSFKLNT